MATADTNRTTNADAAGGRAAETAARTQTGGETATAAGGHTGGHTGGEKKPKERAPRLIVDGREVGRDEYLKAASAAGWNPTVLTERNFYPAISTTK